MTETKNEKFVRLSEARVEKAEFAMQQLHHLTSHNYEYSIPEAESIILRLQNALIEVKTIFGIKASPEPEPEPIEGRIELSPEDNLRMIQIGPQIGAAINAIEDEKPEDAKWILLNLMRS